MGWQPQFVGAEAHALRLVFSTPGALPQLPDEVFSACKLENCSQCLRDLNGLLQVEVDGLGVVVCHLGGELALCPSVVLGRQRDFWLWEGGPFFVTGWQGLGVVDGDRVFARGKVRGVGPLSRKGNIDGPAGYGKKCHRAIRQRLFAIDDASLDGDRTI